MFTGFMEQAIHKLSTAFAISKKRKDERNPALVFLI
jgi:hypothetical protein